MDETPTTVPPPPDPIALRRQLHSKELFMQARAVTGQQRIQTRLDTTRNVWQAWAGDGPFERAEWRGEWGTETGAVRRLRNARVGRPGAMPIDDDRRSRDLPPVADVRVLDGLMHAQDKRRAKPSLGRSAGSALRTIALIAVIAVAAIQALVLLSRRPTPPVAAPPPPQETAERHAEPLPPLPTIEPTEEAPSDPPPTPHRRRR